MKRTKSFFIIFSFFFVLIMLTSCNLRQHEHKYEWKYNESMHWQVCSGCNETTSSQSHTFEEKIIKDATTTDEGLKEYTCSICGYKYEEAIPLVHTHTFKKEWSYDDEYHWHEANCNDTDMIVDKERHSWDRGVVTKSATENETGIKKYTCTVCGKSKEEIIPKTDHVHSFTQKNISDIYLASNATCTKPTTYYYSCSCGEMFNMTFEVGTSLGHSFGEYSSNNDATCTHDGTKTRSCSRCDFKETIMDSGSMLDHSYTRKVLDDEYLAEAATCTHGELYYYSCSMCGKASTETFTIGGQLPHTFANYVSNNDATCTHDGTKTAKCEHCDAIDTIIDAGSMTSHDFSKKITSEEYLVQAATCTSPSIYYYACKDCNKASTLTYESGNPLGHSFTNYISNNDATCSNNGTKTAKCDRCDQTNTITDPNTILDHTYSSDWSFDDNYHWHSATCEHSSYVSNKEAHKWDSGTITKTATETETGIREYVCETCGKSRLEVLPLIIPEHTHNYNQMVTNDEFLTTPADCTNPAVYYYSCTCGLHNDETFESGSPLGHSFTNYISNNDATCTHNGTKTAKCDNCNEHNTIEDTNSKLDHTFTKINPTVDYLKTEADCEHQALYYYCCETCSEKGTETYAYGNALGHRFTNYVFNNDASCEIDGTESATCEICGAINTRVKTGSATGHPLSDEWEYDAEGHWHKRTCVHQDYTPTKDAHDFIELVDDYIPATIDTEGYKVFKCSCGYVIYETVPVLDSFIVKFVFADGNSTSTKYELNTPNSSILSPSYTYVDGYVFKNWEYQSINFDDFDFSNATKDEVYEFIGVYKRLYKVDFIDIAGNVIYTMEVEEGTSIDDDTLLAIKNLIIETNPESYLPYEMSWEDDVLNINSNRIISLKYTIKKFNVTFYDNNGQIIKYKDKYGNLLDSQEVLYGSIAREPEYEKYYFDETNMKLFEFSGWKDSFDYVTTDLDITAIYDISVNVPALIVNLKGNSLYLSIIMPENSKLYVFDIDFYYNVLQGTACQISNITVTDICPLNPLSTICGDVKDCGANHNGEYDWIEYENYDHTFSIHWNCAQGHYFSASKDEIRIDFSVGLGVNFNKEMFKVLPTPTIVYGGVDQDVSTLEKSDYVVYFYES